jgi:hypothetical protein
MIRRQPKESAGKFARGCRNKELKAISKQFILPKTFKLTLLLAGTFVHHAAAQ